jgi:hypothetical protein
MFAANQHNLGIGGKTPESPLPLLEDTVQCFWPTNVEADEHSIRIRIARGQTSSQQEEPEGTHRWIPMQPLWMERHTVLKNSGDTTSGADILANTCYTLLPYPPPATICSRCSAPPSPRLFHFKKIQPFNQPVVDYIDNVVRWDLQLNLPPAPNNWVTLQVLFMLFNCISFSEQFKTPAFISDEILIHPLFILDFLFGFIYLFI